MITGAQIRAARALLKWSANDLAEKAGIGVATIRRFETFDGVPSCQVRVLDILKTTLEKAGVVFIGTADEYPGVQLNIQSIVK